MTAKLAQCIFSRLASQLYLILYITGIKCNYIKLLLEGKSKYVYRQNVNNLPFFFFKKNLPGIRYFYQSYFIIFRGKETTNNAYNFP